MEDGNMSAPPGSGSNNPKAPFPGVLVLMGIWMLATICTLLLQVIRYNDTFGVVYYFAVGYGIPAAIECFFLVGTIFFLLKKNPQFFNCYLLYFVFELLALLGSAVVGLFRFFHPVAYISLVCSILSMAYLSTSAKCHAFFNYKPFRGPANR